MQTIFILISLLISFSVLANTNSKDSTNLKKDIKSKNDIKPKSNVKSKNVINDNDNIEFSKTITVYGMVCAFCSNSLEKKLKKEEAIDQLKVDLKNKKVSVRFKKGKSVEDKKLKEIITSSGFKVIKIESLPNSG